MLFPWVGMLEQMRMADVLVHYDDVQFSKGSFTNRVQVKTAQGCRWMTVPLQDLHLGQRICDVAFRDDDSWRANHIGLLGQSFKGAPHAKDAMEIAADVYSGHYSNIGALARASMLALGHYFGLLDGKRILDVRDLGIPGEGSGRVLDVVVAAGGTTYVTGHGARNYLDHKAFEARGITVEYVRYGMLPYPQLFGPFTPYVTGLDLVAQCGKAGIEYIRPDCIGWREFLEQH